jgi:hypothetical protein
MTPETTAIVQQLEEISVWSLDRCCLDVQILRRTAATAAKALSQERTCSTCRFLDYADVWRERPVCQHRDSPLRHLGTVRPEAFGCLLWEQSDPKEPV